MAENQNYANRLQAFLDAAAQTWPAQYARGIVDAMALPGDTAAGQFATVPAAPGGAWSDEDEARAQLNRGVQVNRAADLAGLVMGGTFGGAPRGALGSGPVRRPINETADDVAKRLRYAGLDATVQNWGQTVGGVSSYITPQYVDSFGIRHTFPQVRISDHGVGPRRFGDHYHVNESGSGADEAIASMQAHIVTLEQVAARRQAALNAVFANPELSAEIARMPKDTGRALKLMRSAGIDTNIEDATAVLRKMRGDLR